MKRPLALIAALPLLALPAVANATVFVTNANHYEAIGDTIGSQFDIINLNSVTGDFTGPGTYLVHEVSFITGLNGNSAGGPFTGFLSNTGVFDGSMFAYDIAYSILISNEDTITLGGNSFVAGGYKVFFNPLVLTNGTSTPVTGSLTATVSAVPEPATWAMMIMGFGLVGGSMRARRSAVRVRYAST